MTLIATAAVATSACGSTTADSRCSALSQLRAAVRDVRVAEAAEQAGNGPGTARAIDDIRGRIARARQALATAAPNDPHTRRLQEAANYLEFIVGQFDRAGTVDATMAQFAARELDRSPPGVPPLRC